MNDAEDLQEGRRAIEAMLALLYDAKRARDAAGNNYEQYSRTIRDYMEREGEDVIADGERGYVASLTPGNAIHNYNVVEMPDELIIHLAQAGCLKVDHAALQKLNLPRLKEAAKAYYSRGEGNKRFSIDKDGAR